MTNEERSQQAPANVNLNEGARIEVRSGRIIFVAPRYAVKY